jgi:hypothetical protein
MMATAPLGMEIEPDFLLEAATPPPPLQRSRSRTGKPAPASSGEADFLTTGTPLREQRDRRSPQGPTQLTSEDSAASLGLGQRRFSSRATEASAEEEGEPSDVPSPSTQAGSHDWHAAVWGQPLRPRPRLQDDEGAPPTSTHTHTPTHTHTHTHTIKHTLHHTLHHTHTIWSPLSLP